MPLDLSSAVDEGIKQWQLWYFVELKDEILENLTGRVLKVQTGILRARTGAFSRITGDTIVVGTNVIYGIAWEKGFTRPGLTIVPKNKKALAFKVGGKTVFAKKVRIPAKRFAARSFIGKALDDTRKMAVDRLGEEVEDAIRRANPRIEVKVRVM